MTVWRCDDRWTSFDGDADSCQARVHSAQRVRRASTIDEIIVRENKYDASVVKAAADERKKLARRQRKQAHRERDLREKMR